MSVLEVLSSCRRVFAHYTVILLLACSVVSILVAIAIAIVGGLQTFAT